MKNFNISTNVYFGENSLGILDTIQDKHVLIVCDSFMESSGIVDKVKEHLSACQVDVFSKVVPDPPIEIRRDPVPAELQSRCDDRSGRWFFHRCRKGDPRTFKSAEHRSYP